MCRRASTRNNMRAVPKIQMTVILQEMEAKFRLRSYDLRGLAASFNLTVILQEMEDLKICFEKNVNI